MGGSRQRGEKDAPDKGLGGGRRSCVQVTPCVTQRGPEWRKGRASLLHTGCALSMESSVHLFVYSLIIVNCSTNILSRLLCGSTVLVVMIPQLYNGHLVTGTVLGKKLHTVLGSPKF